MAEYGGGSILIVSEVWGSAGTSSLGDSWVLSGDICLSRLDLFKASESAVFFSTTGVGSTSAVGFGQPVI